MKLTIIIQIIFAVVITVLISTMLVKAETKVTASVKDNSLNYLIDFIDSREMWVISYDFEKDSKCWVHWQPCGDIKYCVMDGALCVPKH